MKRITLLLTTGLLAISAAQAVPDQRPDMSQLCQGKGLNTKMSAKMGDRTMQGTCQIGFKAKHPNALEHGAMRDPDVQNVCKGKAKGTSVVAKV